MWGGIAPPRPSHKSCQSMPPIPLGTLAAHNRQPARRRAKAGRQAQFDPRRRFEVGVEKVDLEDLLPLHAPDIFEKLLAHFDRALIQAWTLERIDVQRADQFGWIGVELRGQRISLAIKTGTR